MEQARRIRRERRGPGAELLEHHHQKDPGAVLQLEAELEADPLQGQLELEVAVAQQLRQCEQRQPVDQPSGYDERRPVELHQQQQQDPHQQLAEDPQQQLAEDLQQQLAVERLLLLRQLRH